MSKRFYVKDLEEKQNLDEIFLVVEKGSGITVRGSQFLRFKLQDKTGDIEAKRWDASDAEISKINEGDYISVSARVTSYKESLQLEIQSFSKCGENIDPADFMKCSSRDPKEMAAELDNYIKAITNPQLCKLMTYFFDNKDFATKFKQAPAARSIHHDYIGGLLEHTLEVAKTSEALSSVYPCVDKDLLMVGAILHDMGKIEEFVWEARIEYTLAGNLVGHLVQGAMMVRTAAESIEGFDPLLSIAVQHMILAHHGQKEWGSPKRPKSVEALILHFADNISAQVYQFQSEINQSQQKGEKGLFTKKNRLLERAIFKGVPYEEVIAEEAALLTDDKDYDPFDD